MRAPDFILVILISLFLLFPGIVTSESASVNHIDLVTSSLDMAFDISSQPGILAAEPSEGYTLFAPMASGITYLIDIGGNIVHTWTSAYEPGLSVYLAEDGTLFRTAQTEVNLDFDAGGWNNCFQRFDWNSTLLWQFNYSTNQYCGHHDIEVLPNGNVLMIAWEYKTAAEAIDAGRDPAKLADNCLWPEHIIEVQQTGLYTGNIVWEWHVWDHLIQDFDPAKDNYGVVADNPQLMDINFVWDSNPDQDDWLHINSIDYHDGFDQILLSSHHTHELWIIDHSTSTVEASGHTGGNSGMGGDIMYRWGNPRAYQTGDATTQMFFNQHDATWVENGRPGEGNILIFNNGRNRIGPDYSSVEEITPPVDVNGNYSRTVGQAFEPADFTWHYEAFPTPTDMFSGGISGAERLANGNTLICEGDDGYLHEVTPAGEIIWEFTNLLPNPINNNIFKARRYSENYPGLFQLWHYIELDTGWNLISLPRVQSNTSISEVLRSIDGKWDMVRFYNTSQLEPWQSYNVYKPSEMNTLDSLDRRMGIWLHMIEPGTLTVYGSPSNYTEIQMYAGWNLVSYPSIVPETIIDSLSGTGYDRVEGFNASAPYLISQLPDTYLMQPGEGYWVRVPVDAVWIVDW